jgi:hypothetical protein
MRRRFTVHARVAGLAGTLLVAAGAAGVLPFVGGGVPVPRFVTEAAASGLDQAYDGEFEYFVGGGVAAFDCDGDGRDDLFIAGGSKPAALYRNLSPRGGALRFERVRSPVTDLAAVTGAYPLDIDADGELDLVVLRVGENDVLRGLGGCRFERANERWGIDGGGDWTAAFSATWEGESRLPTLAFGNYLQLRPDGSSGDTCAPSRLLRPASTGGEVYAPPLALSPGWCTLSVLFSDWGRTGERDLRMTNDRHYYGDYSDGQDQLWRIVPGERPRPYSADEGWQTLRLWGMGIASQDLTGDGRPEVFLTSQGDSKLQTLAGDGGAPTYTNIAPARGVTATRPYVGDTNLPSTGWHAQFEDVNNDGRMDLFVAKGNVEAMPDFAARDPNNLLLGQADGTFAEAGEAAGIVSFARSRGGALVDLNLDGLLDLVVVNRRVPVEVWRNVGSGSAEKPAPLGHWLAIRARQDGPNRDAIGGWISVRSNGVTVDRELTVGGGHASGQLGWVHVGLGPATGAEVRVQWPDGETGAWQPVDADGFVIIDRDTGPARWTPPG